jgi:probable selenium-dependent hydroxylase accessory protein YqeC
MNSNPPDAGLLDLLQARAGLVCLVGAGGKKTTLYRLAAAHPGRVGITSTVYTPYFPKTLEAARIVTEDDAMLESVTDAAATARVVAFARPSMKHHRLAGLAPARIAQIHERAGFDVTLIKCDGARGRRIKAPGVDEPQVPADASTVIPIVSALAIGQPLSERIAHRVERIAAVTGARPGDPITTEHVARLLASEQGALKNVGAATVVPLINMVDSPQIQALARQAAERTLEWCKGRFHRVVLASMRRAEPVVDVIDH